MNHPCFCAHCGGSTEPGIDQFSGRLASVCECGFTAAGRERIGRLSLVELQLRDLVKCYQQEDVRQRQRITELRQELCDWKGHHDEVKSAYEAAYADRESARQRIAELEQQLGQWQTLAERLHGELNRIRDVVGEVDAGLIDESLASFERLKGEST